MQHNTHRMTKALRIVALLLIGVSACGQADAEQVVRTEPPTSEVWYAEMLTTTTHPPSIRGTEQQTPPITTTTTTTTTLPPPPPTTTTTIAPPPEPPTTTVTEAPRGGNCAGWEDLIAKYFPGEVDTACRVMMCETAGTGSPTIHNSSSTASGLWQFLDSTWVNTTGTAAPAANYSAETQTAAAAKLRNTSGWSQWSCY